MYLSQTVLKEKEKVINKLLFNIKNISQHIEDTHIICMYIRSVSIIE